MEEAGEFSVYWWDKDGGQHEELRFVSPKRAFKACERLITGPASALKIVKRVILTDGSDLTCFEWTSIDGVIYPLNKR